MGLRIAARASDTAEEIAARTVNKERARHGESKTASKTSIHDKSSSERGGERSHKGPGGRTRAQLYEEAKHKNVKGRSSMNKAQLRTGGGPEVTAPTAFPTQQQEPPGSRRV